MFSLLVSLAIPTTPALGSSLSLLSAQPGADHVPIPSSCARRPGRWQGGCGGGSQRSAVCLEARGDAGPGGAGSGGPVRPDNSGKRGSGGRSRGHCSAGHFPRPLQHIPGDGFMSCLFAARAYFGGQATRVPAGMPSPRCWPQTVLTAGQ